MFSGEGDEQNVKLVHGKRHKHLIIMYIQRNFFVILYLLYIYKQTKRYSQRYVFRSLFIPFSGNVAVLYLSGFTLFMRVDLPGLPACWHKFENFRKIFD